MLHLLKHFRKKNTPASFSSLDHFVVIVVNKTQLELPPFMRVPERQLQMKAEAVICQKLMESTLISLRGAEMQENKVLKQTYLWFKESSSGALWGADDQAVGGDVYQKGKCFDQAD